MKHRQVICMSLDSIPSNTAAISPSRSFLPRSVGCFAGPSPAHRDRLISGGGHVDSSPRPYHDCPTTAAAADTGKRDISTPYSAFACSIGFIISSASFNCMSDLPYRVCFREYTMRFVGYTSHGQLDEIIKRVTEPMFLMSPYLTLPQNFHQIRCWLSRCAV